MAGPMLQFPPAQLEALCKCLAVTHGGLSGTEIGHILGQVGVEDRDPTMIKWKRLFNALAVRQNADQNGDRVFALIRRAMDPARYHGMTSVFRARCVEINGTLAYLGFEFREDGKFHRCKRAETHLEAEARAGRRRSQLEIRKVYTDVLASCRAELVESNCFHAVLESCKSVAARIRARTDSSSDGVALVQEAFGGDRPRLRINAHLAATEKSEQRGFVNRASGFFGIFRNPTAHTPRSEWPTSEEDAVDMLTLASYLHRRVDGVT